MKDPVILHVDDASDDVFFLKEALTLASFKGTIVAVSDGMEAQQYLLGDGKYGDRHKFPLPDLVIFGLQIPNFSGCQFIEWMRRECPHDVPVFVFCSWEAVGDVHQILRTGVSEVFVKPASIEEWPTQARALIDAYISCKHATARFV